MKLLVKYLSFAVAVAVEEAVLVEKGGNANCFLLFALYVRVEALRVFREVLIDCSLDEIPVC